MLTIKFLIRLANILKSAELQKSKKSLFNPTKEEKLDRQKKLIENRIQRKEKSLAFMAKRSKVLALSKRKWEAKRRKFESFAEDSSGMDLPTKMVEDAGEIKPAGKKLH